MNLIKRYFNLTTIQLVDLRTNLNKILDNKKTNGLLRYHSNRKYHMISNEIVLRNIYAKIGTMPQEKILINNPKNQLRINNKIEWLENNRIETGIIDEIKDMGNYLLYFIKRF